MIRTIFVSAMTLEAFENVHSACLGLHLPCSRHSGEPCRRSARFHVRLPARPSSFRARVRSGPQRLRARRNRTEPPSERKVEVGCAEQENEESEELPVGGPQRRDRFIEHEDDECGECESATGDRVGIRDRTAATPVGIYEMKCERETENRKVSVSTLRKTIGGENDEGTPTTQRPSRAESRRNKGHYIPRSLLTRSKRSKSVNFSDRSCAHPFAVRTEDGEERTCTSGPSDLSDTKEDRQGSVRAETTR